MGINNEKNDPGWSRNRWLAFQEQYPKGTHYLPDVPE